MKQLLITFFILLTSCVSTPDINQNKPQLVSLIPTNISEDEKSTQRDIIGTLYKSTCVNNDACQWNYNFELDPCEKQSGIYCKNGYVTGISIAGHLQGNIPPDLSKLKHLNRLELNGNRLSGSIPPELGSITTLQYLHFGGNQLSGSIPPELGNLALLETLGLNNNKLSGHIPKELGKLRLLRQLTLENNTLTGSIPRALGNKIGRAHV